MNSSLSFFPIPYPDELFYSVIARYVYYTPKQALSHKKDDLFASAHVRPLLKFASNLEEFCQNIDYLYAPEEILQDMTLYPYFSPFISAQRQENAYRAARFRANTLTSSIGAKNTSESRLKIHWCPCCSREDKKYLGETYLHRSHHMDGIDICPKHLVGLMDYEIHSEFLKDRVYHYFQPDLSQEVLQRPAQDYEIKLATVAKGLFGLSFHQYNLVDITKMLRSLFIDKGLATKKVFHYREIYENLLQIFPEEFLEENSLLISNFNKGHWLNNFFIRQKIFHPLEGIVLIASVSDSITDFTVKAQEGLRKEEIFPDFGVCHNPFCRHYNRPEVRKVSVESNYSSAVYRCECGQVYRQFGDSQDHYSIVQFGDLYGQRIEELKKKGLSDQKIAQRCHISRKGITKQLTRKNYSQVDKKVAFYQNQILEEISNNPEVSRQELNDKFSSALLYLKKYCPEFYADLDLPVNCFKLTYCNNKEKPVQKDEHYARQIEEIAQRLYDQRPEVMVSQKRIIENLKPKVSPSTIKRLEKSSQILNSLYETRHDYFKRKIINRLIEIIETEPNYELNRKNVKKSLNLNSRKMNLYWSEIVTFVTEWLQKNAEENSPK